MVSVCVVQMSSILAAVMSTPPYLSPFELDSDYYHGDDFSSGYLEDALLELGDRSKRRRLSFSSSERSLPLGYMNSGTRWDMPSQNHHHYCSTRIGGLAGFTDELGGISISTSEEETANVVSEIQTSSEDAMSLSSLDSSTCSLNPMPPSNPITNARQVHLTTHPPGIVGRQELEKRKQQSVIKGVAYPFTLVKPGGSEGDVTLEDINTRILMTPTRPVRHPVGDFACRPYGGGPGLSGKVVVGLTRLHTQGGRGSITIIRTRG